ncbi:type VII secretion system-associated protein [Streptomyces sp. NPDC001389]|uniref:type VII secretion system-associated protein n=1 Tax=unclassified Streptomyces TaxID=2593676 RepID=UPI0036AB4192
MADLTHLDAKGLQTFVDNDVADFIKALKAIREDAPSGKALRSAIVGKNSSTGDLGRNKFLVIGGMGADAESEPNGKVLIEAVKKGAKAIDDILVAQQAMFKDIDRNLTETIRTLLKTQGASLGGISAEKLLDIFSDVDGGPGSTAGSGASAK